MAQIHIELLYQDEAIVVVNKPTGLMIHRNTYTQGEHDTVLGLLSQQLKHSLHVVHRLDRPTAGVMVFAKHAEAAKHFSRVFSQKQVEKTYLCIVQGTPESQGIIDQALKKKPTNQLQPAQTHYKKVAQADLPITVGEFDRVQYALLSVQPLTGRRHQIRRHLAFTHHPIIGDKKYGLTAHNRLWEDQLEAPGLMLQAHQLRFPHPDTQETVGFTAPLAPHMQVAFDQMGWNQDLIST